MRIMKISSFDNMKDNVPKSENTNPSPNFNGKVGKNLVKLIAQEKVKSINELVERANRRGERVDVNILTSVKEQYDNLLKDLQSRMSGMNEYSVLDYSEGSSPTFDRFIYSNKKIGAEYSEHASSPFSSLDMASLISEVKVGMESLNDLREWAGIVRTKLGRYLLEKRGLNIEKFISNVRVYESPLRTEYIEKLVSRQNLKCAGHRIEVPDTAKIIADGIKNRKENEKLAKENRRLAEY